MRERFEELKESNNPEELNEFIIKLAEDPREEYLDFVSYFVKNLSEPLLNKVKINLIYLIGVLSKKLAIDQFFLEFLKKQYYLSDRWIRNEIIKALSEIAKKQPLKDKYIELISISLREEYIPIKKNALEALNKTIKIQYPFLKEILPLMGSHNSEITEKSKKLLTREINNYRELYHFLNIEDNYKMMNKNNFRAILVAFFNSVFYLEEFRKLLQDSNWENDHKQVFLEELDTYERLLLKKR
jgi:hypothetical protein